MSFSVGETGHVEEHNRIVTEQNDHETRIAALEAGGGGGGGTGTVTEVNGVPPDGTGNVSLTVSDIPNAVDDSDSRLTDARTPLAHAASHAEGGSDALSPSAIGAITQADGDDRYAPLSAGTPVLVFNGAYPSKPIGITNGIFVGASTNDPGSAAADGDLWIQPEA